MVAGGPDLVAQAGGLQAVPRGEADQDPAVTALADKLPHFRADTYLYLRLSAPRRLVPDRQQLPDLFRGGGQQVGVGVDAYGVIAAGGKLIQRLVPVLVARARPSALEPGEVPHCDGKRP